MIAHVRGTVAHRDAGTVVVDVQGVGYLVHVPAGADVPARGQQVELATSLQVREDSMTLYGFPDPSARTLFELLLSASGVGPKLALAILSTLRATTVVTAITSGDLDLLTTVPGIGKKSAQRLVLELREKLGALGETDVLGAGGVPVVGAGGAEGPQAEVREALVGLGYGPAEVASAMATLQQDADAADDDTSTLLRRALRLLGGAS